MSIGFDSVLGGLRVLLMLPDNATARTSAAEVLRHSGVELTVEFHEGRVRRILEREGLDVVVSAGFPPTPDVVAFCEWARQLGPELIIIGVAGASDLTSRVMALGAGADDCVSADVHPLELVARMRAIHRRLRRAPAGESVEPVETRFGPYVVDPVTARLTRAGQVVAITESEYALLWALLRRRGKPVSRETLLRELRGRARSNSQRAIDVLVMRLRRKLGARADGGSYIETVRGFGYRFAQAGADGAEYSRSQA